MSPLSKEVLKQALDLPPVERAELVERLILSFELPDRRRIDELWAAEAEDRIDAYEAGKMPAYPAKDVFDEINRQTGSGPSRSSPPPRRSSVRPSPI